MNTPQEGNEIASSSEVPLDSATSGQVNDWAKAVDALLLTENSTLDEAFDLDKVYKAPEFLYIMSSFYKAKGGDLTRNWLINLLWFNKIDKYSTVHFTTPPVSPEKPKPRVSIILDNWLFRAAMDYDGNRL